MLQAPVLAGMARVLPAEPEAYEPQRSRHRFLREGIEERTVSVYRRLNPFSVFRQALQALVFKAWAKRVGMGRQSALRQSAAMHHWADKLLNKTWKRWRLLVVLHQAHNRIMEEAHNAADVCCRRLRMVRGIKVSTDGEGHKG
jgi:hypothetical protein